MSATRRGLAGVVRRLSSDARAATPGSVANVAAGGRRQQQQPMLLRDWLRHCQHVRQEGLAHLVETCLPHPLKFRAMIGEGAYRKALAEAYAANPLASLTPSEALAPYYSQALGGHILDHYQKSPKAARGPLVVYEAGGGAGASAGYILDLLRLRSPEIYSTARYTLLQPCAALAERARRGAGTAHARRLQVIQEDALSWARTRREPDPLPCYVVGLELLATLPHDKVAHRRLGQGAPPQLCEAVLACSEAGVLEETYRPLHDDIITRLLELCPDVVSSLAVPPEREGIFHSVKGFVRSLSRNSKPVYSAAFVPTGALELMTALHNSLPKHHLVLADFDSLAKPKISRQAADAHADVIAGTRAPPLISTSDPVTGKVEDHPSYLLEPGTADICFPTDFDALKQLYCRVARRDPGTVRAMKQGAFLKTRKLEAAAATTRTDYNPMLEDYTNYSVLLS